MGQSSSGGTPAVERQNNAVIKIKFSQRDCHACASRLKYTHAKRRTMTVRPHNQSLSVQAARQREQTTAY
jgi:hypothetical protein